MRVTGPKITFLLCILSLISPFLCVYAQNEVIPLRIIPLPEKEQLIPAIPLNIPLILKKDPLENTITSAVLEPSNKGIEKNIDGTNLPFPGYLIVTRQSIAFAQAYEKTNKVFLDFIDKKVYTDTLENKDEKRFLREQWQKFLGVDIWYPYFKAKEVEDWIGEKTKVELFHFKGRMRFENNQIKYTFKAQF